MDAGHRCPATDAAAMRDRAFLRAFLVVLICCFASVSRAAEPASDTAHKLFFWKVTGSPGVVYLLGTVHVGKAELYPLAAIIESSFGQADVLVTEADLVEAQDPAHLLKMLLQRGVYPIGDSVEKHIGEETRAHLTRYIETTKELASSYTRLKPWFLSVAIAMAEAKRMGFATGEGLDKHFVDAAVKIQKPIATLETVESQLNLMNSFSDELQDQFLLAALLDAEHKSELIDRLLQAWKSGNIEAMAETTMRYADEYPRLKPVFEKMFDQRNDGMARQIEQFLQTPKTYFVAVGAGHLLGERGILSQLRRNNYDVEQLQDRGIKSAAKFSRKPS